MGQYIEFKEGEKYPIKKIAETDTSDNVDAFKDAGYLLTDDDLVIDLDCLDHIQIKKLIDTFKINTEIVWTTRGAHLYFKKPEGFRGGKEKPTALGIEVEYKYLPSTKAVTIRQNGKTRPVDNARIREALPDIFKPNKKCKVLLGFGEGDGRNNALRQHKIDIMALSNWKPILKFINEVIFSEPLEVKEFEVVARDEPIMAEKGREAFMADLIINQQRIVKYKDSLYFYDGKRFINDRGLLKNIVDGYCLDMATRYIDEVIKKISYRLVGIDPGSEFAIKLKNGVLKNGVFYEVDYTEFTPYYIDIDYIEDAPEVPEVVDYLKNLAMSKDLKTSEPAYGLLIIEALASSLITDRGFKRALSKFFFFVGDGGNGKGTFIEIATAILGRDNVTTLVPAQMCEESYLVTMEGKLANFGDDIPDEPINTKQMKILKNISTCDRIEVRHLYAESRSTEITTSVIFTCNSILKSFEKGEAFKRRVLWMPMFYKPKTKERDFIKRLTEKKALEYWLRLIVEGYERLYKAGGYTHSEIVQAFTDEYHEENDPTREWLDTIEVKNVLNKSYNNVYRAFKTWYESENMVRMKDGQYKKILKEAIYIHFNLKHGEVKDPERAKGYVVK